MARSEAGRPSPYLHEGHITTEQLHRQLGRFFYNFQFGHVQEQLLDVSSAEGAPYSLETGADDYVARFGVTYGISHQAIIAWSEAASREVARTTLIVVGPDGDRYTREQLLPFVRDVAENGLKATVKAHAWTVFVAQRAGVLSEIPGKRTSIPAPIDTSRD